MKEIEELIGKLVTGRREVAKRFMDGEQYHILPHVCDYETQITELSDAQKIAIRAIVTDDPVAWNALCDHLQESLMYGIYDSDEEEEERDE